MGTLMASATRVAKSFKIQILMHNNFENLYYNTIKLQGITHLTS